MTKTPFGNAPTAGTGSRGSQWLDGQRAERVSPLTSAFRRLASDGDQGGNQTPMSPDELELQALRADLAGARANAREEGRQEGKLESQAAREQLSKAAVLMSQALHRQQSLARVAAEVRSRMVFGGRSTAAVAATPKHAVASDAVVSLVSSGGSASPSLKASNTLDAGTAAAARQDLELQRQRSGTAEAAPRGGAASREHGRQMHAPSCFSCFTICGSRPAVNVP